MTGNIRAEIPLKRSRPLDSGKYRQGQPLFRRTRYIALGISTSVSCGLRPQVAYTTEAPTINPFRRKRLHAKTGNIGNSKAGTIEVYNRQTKDKLRLRTARRQGPRDNPTAAFGPHVRNDRRPALERAGLRQTSRGEPLFLGQHGLHFLVYLLARETELLVEHAGRSRVSEMVESQPTRPASVTGRPEVRPNLGTPQGNTLC